MSKKKIRSTNRTVLLVVEGYTEEAFVKHLKLMYVGRDSGISLSVKNARGHGPEGVAGALSSACRIASFDHKAAILDSDIEPCKKSIDYFRAENVHLFVSVPAIEATLLGLLGTRVRDNISTAECKQILQRQLGGDCCDRRYYERHFSRPVIESARANVELVDGLLKYMADPVQYLKNIRGR